MKLLESVQNEVRQPGSRPTVIETSRREQNEERPKKRLGGLTLAAYAKT
jgi:hypothetical protein